MKSLLSALQEGRLVELPDPDKDKALEYLALLIEAIPDVHNQADIVQEVKDREATASTALGKGIACPHARKSGEGDLLCAVGWSPQGIDYGAPDGQKVHLVIMYFIPDSQRNSYLKEISGLAKAVEKTYGIASIANAGDIHAVRSQLLDWVGFAIDSAIPDAKARMIKLQDKQAAILAAEPGKALGRLRSCRSLSLLPIPANPWSWPLTRILSGLWNRNRQYRTFSGKMRRSNAPGTRSSSGRCRVSLRTGSCMIALQ